MYACVTRAHKSSERKREVHKHTNGKIARGGLVDKEKQVVLTGD